MENKLLNKATLYSCQRQQEDKQSLRGQVMLEASLAFVLIAVLLGGIINIWLWSNKQIVERQLRYNQGRVAAGTSSDTYQRLWPVYRPAELTEDMVIKVPYENKSQ